MQYVREELFHFLEQSPYFYEKSPVVIRKGDDEDIKEAEDEQITHINYTFFDEDRICQTIAEISIPVNNPSENIRWKFIQMNEDTLKPIYQSINPEINKMPDWYQYLLISVQSKYETAVSLFRYFSPKTKN